MVNSMIHSFFFSPGSGTHRHCQRIIGYRTNRNGGRILPEGIRSYGCGADVVRTGGGHSVQARSRKETSFENNVVAEAASWTEVSRRLAENTSSTFTSIESSGGHTYLVEICFVVQEKWIIGK